MTSPGSRSVSAYGRVAVLMGGWSGEREVSLLGGQAVLAALQSCGVDAWGIDLTRERAQHLEHTLQGFDRVFILLHGLGGEDGTLQGALDLLGLPYTGSGVLGSALGMDKLACKRIWAGDHLPTAPYRILNADFAPDDLADALGLPLIVKPSLGGSSLGMTRVDTAESLPAAYALASQIPGAVFAEQWITGTEYTVAILDNQPLPVIQIVAQESFYDYHAKYFSDATRYLCPPPLESMAQIELQTLALSAFAAIEGRGWGRVDILRSLHGEHYLMEVNTVPGMTSHSLVPMAAAARGIDFAQLCLRILDTSLPGEARAHAG
jgi:D-alanine-D-alanine ligase